MPLTRIIYLAVMTLIIVGLCVLSISKGHSELTIYYILGLIVIIAAETVRIVLDRKKK